MNNQATPFRFFCRLNWPVHVKTRLPKTQFAALITVAAVVALSASVSTALPTQESEAQPAPSTDLAQLEDEFNRIQSEFLECVCETHEIGVRFIHSPTLDQASDFENPFDQSVAKGNEILERWIQAGEKLFWAQCDADMVPKLELRQFMSKVLERRFDESDFSGCCVIAEKLLELQPDDSHAGYVFCRSALRINRFDPKVANRLIKFSETFQGEGAITEAERGAIVNILYLNDEFGKEKEIRDNEAADQLPRVLFKTNKGDFVVELFENEAPNTVANFISLVEAKHYDGLAFDTVIDQTVAQSGVVAVGADEEIYQMRPVGYKIKTETDRPDARKCFSGSLMMISPDQKFADSIICVALAPLPNMHGQQTTFGRVVSGMETLYQLNPTVKIEEQKQKPIPQATPDKIISAEIIRKRDHDYVPEKIKP